MLIPDNTTPKDWFPLYDGIKLTAQFYFYYIFEHLGMIILSYIAAAEERIYQFEAKVFFFLMCAGLVDFILTYNSVWFHVGILPISMNILSTSIFGIVIFMAWMRTRDLN